MSDANNAFAELLARFGRNSLAFVREVLGIEPDPWQVEVLQAVDRGETRIAIRSGHGVGKSSCLSWIMLWFLLTRFPCKVVVTAPTATQLFDALWADLKANINKLPGGWRSLLDAQSDHVSLRIRPDEAFISARTSRAENPDSLQGVHSRNVLLVADEASGIPEEVFKAAGGSMSTTGAITILAGNPTRSTGFFWRVHNLEAARWMTRQVSCLDSPRVDPKWISEIRERYGEDSNEYRVRVLGAFPLSEGDTLIPAVLVEESMRRVPTLDEAAPEIWGVDVARFGTDCSTLVKRQGFAVLEPARRWHGMDTMQLTGAIHAEAKHRMPAAIVVDAIGLGAGVADRLRELGLPAIDCNVAESPSSDRFVRLRDELWQAVRDWLDGHTASMPWDDQLRAELCAPRYGYSSDGRLKVESKDAMRARGVGSPDCFIAGTLVETPGGPVAIERLRIGDLVTTPFGPTPIIAAWTDRTATLTTVELSSGRRLAGTGKHKVFVWGVGERRLDALTLTDSLEPFATRRLAAWKLLNGLRIKARCSEFRAVVAITSRIQRSSPSGFCIVTFGLSITALYRAVMTFTTRMRTGGTTISKISNCWRQPSISGHTSSRTWRSPALANGTRNISIGPDWPPPSGTARLPAWLGTANMGRECSGGRGRSTSGSASDAAEPTRQKGRTLLNTVQNPADIKLTTQSDSRLSGFVSGAARIMWAVATGKSRTVAPVGVQVESVPPTPVFNLTLAEHNAYYANGVLVFNSADALCLTLSPGALLAAAYGFARMNRPLRRHIKGVV